MYPPLSKGSYVETERVVPFERHGVTVELPGSKYVDVPLDRGTERYRDIPVEHYTQRPKHYGEHSYYRHPELLRDPVEYYREHPYELERMREREYYKPIYGHQHKKEVLEKEKFEKYYPNYPDRYGTTVEMVRERFIDVPTTTCDRDISSHISTFSRKKRVHVHNAQYPVVERVVTERAYPVDKHGVTIELQPGREFIDIPECGKPVLQVVDTGKWRSAPALLDKGEVVKKTTKIVEKEVIAPKRAV